MTRCLTITPALEALINLRYPELTPREQGNRIREDLYKTYINQLHREHEAVKAAMTAKLSPAEPEVPFVTVPTLTTSRDIADYIAGQAPRIDDQNWAAIRRGVEQAQEQGKWDGTDDMIRLIERLTVDFDGAQNEYRVQKSRITAFFERML